MDWCTDTSGVLSLRPFIMATKEENNELQKLIEASKKNPECRYFEKVDGVHVPCKEFTDVDDDVDGDDYSLMRAAGVEEPDDGLFLNMPMAAIDPGFVNFGMAKGTAIVEESDLSTLIFQVENYETIELCENKPKMQQMSHAVRSFMNEHYNPKKGDHDRMWIIEHQSKNPRFPLATDLYGLYGMLYYAFDEARVPVVTLTPQEVKKTFDTSRGNNTDNKSAALIAVRQRMSAEDVEKRLDITNHVADCILMMITVALDYRTICNPKLDKKNIKVKIVFKN